MGDDVIDETVVGRDGALLLVERVLGDAGGVIDRVVLTAPAVEDVFAVEV